MQPIDLQDAPSLVVRAPAGPAVRHLLLRVPPGLGGRALDALASLSPSFGPSGDLREVLSVGFSFAGLVALNLPVRYQGVFRRLAPAFREGAVLRSRRLGDGGANAVAHWQPAFEQDRAHVLVSWHGPAAWVQDQADALRLRWPQGKGGPWATCFEGERLAGPNGEAGDWLHFGYRDGISEVVIGEQRSSAPDPRRHEAGELLLGHPNDAGHNRFALTRLREPARRFFRGGSFGIFRPICQDVGAFEAQVDRWQRQLAPLRREGVSREFVKAKLCGRWPDGRILAPGRYEPEGNDFVMARALAADTLGEGCPFGSHARRMRDPEDRLGLATARALQRRSVPFGAAAWRERPPAGDDHRGLLGHFFCSSIESQFEHLVGQWAARPPLGSHEDERARDPLAGPHEDPTATLRIPMPGRSVQALADFGAWARTLGTVYAWYPDQPAWQRVLSQDYAYAEDEEPWT